MRRMPSPPSPLANLPRPLSERERGRGWRGGGLGRRLGVLVAIGVSGAAGLGLVSSLSDGPLTPVGDVQGAIVSPGPSEAASPDPPATTPRRTADPVLTATPSPTPAPPSTLTGYQWPLPRGRVTLPFGPSPWGTRIVHGETFHDGVDFATFCGDRIVAAHSGTVLAAGRRYDQMMGWIGDLEPYLARLEKKGLFQTLPIVVVIDDGNGYRSVYAHFGKIKVKRGQVVKAGQTLGWEGATGRASGCHLHYGLFSPLETATFGLDPDVARRMRLPDRQIARIDPMLVLPERPKPSKSPTASGSPSPTP